MFDDETLADLKTAIRALGKQDIPAGAWEALPALARLGQTRNRIEIDLAASSRIGAPLVIAHPNTPSLAPLTPRQREVAKAILSGCSNREIADRLGIRLCTVKDHVHAVLSRLGLKRRSQIAGLMQSSETEHI